MPEYAGQKLQGRRIDRAVRKAELAKPRQDFFKQMFEQMKWMSDKRKKALKELQLSRCRDIHIKRAIELLGGSM